MNLLTIFSDLEQRDTDAYDKFTFSRRKLLKTTAITAAATTGLVAATMNKAFAADSDVIDVLNFALLLEYLEAEFYATALDKQGLIPSTDTEVFMLIGMHEKEHVDFLKAALGSSAIAKPTFDFTAGGKFPTVFSDYQIFLLLSQSFEDLGVRAYKGQAPRLQGNKDVLLSALKIHSVEARHAGEVRLIRGLRVWTSEQDNGGAPAGIYAGENMMPHLSTVDLPPLVTPYMLQDGGTQGQIIERTIREAYDEPLTKEEVLALATPFVKS